MAVHPLWEKYPTIQKDLIETKKVMEKSVKIRNKDITQALQLFFEAGGKLLRPAYFLLFSKLGEEVSEKKAHRMAASLEILHVATLIHDDIIDDSPMRRSMPSIQAMYGQDIAVYTGDFLFTVYFHLLATSTKSFRTIEMNAHSMKRILVGELDQMKLRYNTDITVKQYFQHIKGKTAQLFEFACFEGAHFGGSSKAVQLNAKRIGYNIGMAFQIMDDVLDYKATATDMQKPVFEDMKNGYYTLPLILAMEKNHDAFVPYLEKKTELSNAEMKEVQDLIAESKGIERAEEIAKRFTDRALSGIKKLPASQERDILFDVTSTLLNRNN
ncbi:polyprenyl synthetase family protein [Vagococcus sp. DIV0080]|uniref:Polyprenyl synthetase family protein n=1 Tax=Candidatus Vagococcus giribetii TaxID=2230876 RepID=A0ABS3HPP5_9ENTE|nr:polyprenyl synthetase family protein [Vagococcus sp. DIV0080]MBO0475711.1 polyprenyl synthetase family protein [Vagococcus sp. DIV0080]